MASAVPDEYAAFANELADAAGAVVLKYWRQKVAVESKDDPDRPVAESPVTIADREAERVMRDMIGARYPAHAILGEELGEKGDAKTAEWAWVLDPIDGTKSFITGKPLFGTLIALLHEGAPALGVIDQCVLKERWVGTARGTTLNGAPVRTDAACTRLGDAMVYATTPEMFAPGFETSAWAALRNRVKRALYGCDCYAYALLASGHVELVCEADLMPYDYLAVVPVILGAGGVATDWRGQALTLPNHAASNGRVLCAANRTLHVAALVALHEAPPPENAPRRAFLRGVALGLAFAALAGAVVARR